MKNYGTFDIESMEWIRYLISASFDGESLTFHKSVDSLLDCFNKKEYRNWVWYAHNGGRFDFLFLVEAMENRGWNLDFTYSGSRIVALTVFTGLQKFELRDSLGILRGSLRELADTFGVEHRKGEIDYNSITRVTRELKEYLENDCRALYEVITRFSSLEYMSNLKITIASQAMSVFTTNFCRATLVKTKEELGTKIRSLYYHGGRCEVYRFRGSSLYYYDVNSLYPFAMLGEMPCGTIRETDREERDKIGFYRVRIQSTPPYYVTPLLYTCGRNRFIVGPGTYALGSPTLELLREHGVRYRVIDGYVAESREVLFDDYVRHFYNIKQHSRGTAMYLLAKLLLNALYGKFGQKYEQMKVVRYDSLPENEDAFVHTDHPDYVLVPEKTKSRFLLPFLAAYITERARVIHYRYMSAVEGGMYYCDTDSLITSLPCRTGTALGDLSLKGVFDFCSIGCKSYALRTGQKETIVFKGFASRSFTYDDFDAVLTCRRDYLTEYRPEVLSFLEVQKRETRIDDRRGKYLALVHRRKFQSFQYDSRIMVPGGPAVFDTEPMTVRAVEAIEETS